MIGPQKKPPYELMRANYSKDIKITTNNRREKERERERQHVDAGANVRRQEAKEQV